jgi:hypothetical protein
MTADLSAHIEGYRIANSKLGEFGLWRQGITLEWRTEGVNIHRVIRFSSPDIKASFIEKFGSN